MQARLLAGTLATNVVLRATLPAGLQFVSATADRGAGCSGTQAVVCNLDFLNAQAPLGTVTLTVRGTTAGSKSVALQVSASQNDAAAANNSGSVAVTVGSAGPNVRRVGATPTRTVQAVRARAWVTLTAAVQAQNATSMVVSVTPQGSVRKLTMLKGSKVGSVTAKGSVKSITIRPGTRTRQLALRLATSTVAKGKRYLIVVTVTNAAGSKGIRIPVRG